MRKHILIPTDFSENAWNALNYATALYRKTNCTFYLLHAFQLFHFPSDTLKEPQPGEKEYEKEREASEKGLKKLVNSMESRLDHRNQKFEMISTYNTVLEAVKQAIAEYQIAMVVMGTKGEDNPNHLFYGSNAVDIMENAKKCPVLVIPEKSNLPEGVLREIVFATNFKFPYKKVELEPLLEIAGFYKAVTRILYIADSKNFTEEQERNKEELKNYFEGFLHSFHTLSNTKVIPGIHSFIDDRSSNLLVIYNRKHGFLSGFFSRSLVKDIGNQPQIPLLVIKEI